MDMEEDGGKRHGKRTREMDMGTEDLNRASTRNMARGCSASTLIDDDDSGGYGLYIASLHTHTHECF
jgi:hypothetical protein